MLTTSNEDGIEVVEVGHGGVRELFVTATPGGVTDLESLLPRIHELLVDSQAEVLETRIFGTVGAFPSCVEMLQGRFGSIEWPLAFIQGKNCFANELAGLQLHAVAGAPVKTIQLEGRPVGRVFEDHHTRYCVLGNLQSPDPSLPRDLQTKETFQQLSAGLAAAGMNLHSLARTWFFIDEILGWYQDFNQVRSEIYEAAGIFDAYLPASTGIGGSNPQESAVVASALAIQGKGEGVGVRDIPSPLQCPPLDYGSSFTRAAEMVTPGSRAVLVSGTASIDPEGVTAHLGDVDAQIAFTIEVVEAILKSRNLSFQDVTRGNAYFKDSEGALTFKEHATRHGLPLSRLVVSQNDVCREDLLFELEVDAKIAEEQ